MSKTSSRTHHLWDLFYKSVSSRRQNADTWHELREIGYVWDQNRPRDAVEQFHSSEYEIVNLPVEFIGLLLSWSKPVFSTGIRKEFVKTEDLDLLQAFLEGMT